MDLRKTEGIFQCSTRIFLIVVFTSATEAAPPPLAECNLTINKAFECASRTTKIKSAYSYKALQNLVKIQFYFAGER
jgi:hypothetical protein